MTLHIQVITPEKVVVDEEADELIIPTVTGELSILPHHVPLLTQLKEGELIIKKSGRQEYLAVIGGFLEVGATTVTVLADYATAAKDISEAQAQRAKERAEKIMNEKVSNEDFAAAEAEFRRAILELKVAKRHKSS